MYRKNTAGQFLCVQLILTATGAVGTGLSPAARRCIDGTFAAGGGTFTEDGSTGSYKYAMAQADTNGNDISIIVTATGCIPVCVNFTTTAADPSDSVRFGLTALPNAAAEAAGGLYTRGTGAGQITQSTNGQIDVDAKKWNSLATVALPLVPTTAGRTLDVSATGEAGVDWANVGSPTTAVDLSGTTIKTTQKVDVDTVKTNPVVNGGTITFPTNSTLASTTNITAATGVDATKIAGDTVAATALSKSTNSICYGTCSGGSTTTAVVSTLVNPASLTASGQLIGRTIIFLGATSTGALQAQASNITNSTTGATPTITFTAMTTAPANGDTFVVL